MSLQIAQLSLKCEPLVSASGTGVAGLRWNGADRFTWQQTPPASSVIAG